MSKTSTATKMSDAAVKAGYTVERVQVRESYPRNGNVMNPTIEYGYHVDLNGKRLASYLPKRGVRVRQRVRRRYAVTLYEVFASEDAMPRDHAAGDSRLRLARAADVWLAAVQAHTAAPTPETLAAAQKAAVDMKAIESANHDANRWRTARIYPRR